MKKKSVRITLDLPASLDRQLEKHAAATSKSVRELLLEAVKRVASGSIPPDSKRVRFPLIGSDGPKIDVTNEKIYELVEFP